MAIQIQSGGPNVKIATVDSTGSLFVRSKSITQAQEAAKNGGGFNLNTGIISLTSANESAILFYKHFEERPIVIDAIILGIETNNTDLNSTSKVKIVRNPSTGTIVSTATAGEVKINRNFSNVSSLDASTFYKGAEGLTITDGSVFAYAYAGYGRSVLPVDLYLSKGNSLGITLDLQANTSTINCYCVLVCNLEQGDVTQ